jgi:hypothetical protein
VSNFQLAGAIAGFVAVFLSILLNLSQLLALFARGKCLITSRAATKGLGRGSELAERF